MCTFKRNPQRLSRRKFVTYSKTVRFTSRYVSFTWHFTVIWEAVGYHLASSSLSRGMKTSHGSCDIFVRSVGKSQMLQDSPMQLNRGKWNSPQLHPPVPRWNTGCLCFACDRRWSDPAAVTVVWGQSFLCQVPWPSWSKPAETWPRAASKPDLNTTPVEVLPK